MPPSEDEDGEDEDEEEEEEASHVRMHTYPPSPVRPVGMN
jgi:hypothetical protein